MAVRKLDQGKYLIDFTWTENGKRRRLRRQFFGSSRDAQKLERDLRNEARVGSLLPREVRNDDPTFDAFADEWMELYVEVNNRPVEQKTKESYLRVHLRPFFGAMLMSEITRRDVERFKAEKVVSGLSPGSVNHYLKTLRTMFRCAIDWEIVQANPTQGTSRLKDREDKWGFLTVEESEKFMAAVPVPWYPLFLFALRTGMRQGEILGLRWEDMFWDRRVIRVQNALSLEELMPTKSGKSREIPMTTDLVEALLPLRGGASPFVFSAQDGGPLHRKTLQRPLNTANRNSGVKRVRFHDLRHSFASQLAIAEVPIRTIQELLGHADMKMTLRYAHLTEGASRKAIERLDAALRRKGCDESVTVEG